MTAIRAHRLTAGAASTDTYDRHTAQAVYGFLAQILPGPRLRDAACRGDHAWMWDETRDQRGGEDPQQRAQRLQRAQVICRGCPALEACKARRFADPKLPGGMWAGQLYRTGRSEPSPIVCIICGAGLSDTRHKMRAGTCGDPDCTRRADAEREARRRRPRRRAAPMAPCPRCDTPFPKSGRRNYCTTDCARLANTDRKRAAREAARPRPWAPCAECGGVIPHGRRRGRVKTCSEVCGAIQLRATRAAYRAAQRVASTPQGGEVAAA